jgi:hypothetical protein
MVFDGTCVSGIWDIRGLAESSLQTVDVEGDGLKEGGKEYGDKWFPFMLGLVEVSCEGVVGQ